MIIDVVFDSSTKSAPAGFFTAVNAAVEYWERALINPITVTIDFGYNEVGGQTIGRSALAESKSQGITLTYAQVKAGLSSAATSANDAMAVANLPASDPSSGAGYFVALAQAEVLGQFSTANTTVGAAGLSSAFPFTFDPNNRSVPGEYDAIGAMEHEISEVLGRIAGSGVVQGGVAQFSPLDLFRYASAGQLATRPEGAFFSIDGAHMLLPFNNPGINGQNGDAGDWASSVIGDSFGDGSQGVAGLVSPTDLELMDVLGYKLAPDPTARNDYNADGKSDFLIESASGLVGVGEVSNGHASYTFPTSLAPSQWTIVGKGDYLGAGHDQMLIENIGSSAGIVGIGDVENGQVSFTFPTALAASQWKFVGSGDFLGTGAEDQFLIENTGSNAGLVGIGDFGNGHASFTFPTALAPTQWSIVGTGDFLGDGKSDILIENIGSNAGLVGIGEVSNGQVAFTFPTAVATSQWEFVGTGDFLGDGKDQFLIENIGGSAGLLGIGEVTGGQVAFTFPTALASQWTIVGTGDYLAEGHDQFLMENTSGAIDVGDYTGGQVHFTQVSTLQASLWTFH